VIPERLLGLAIVASLVAGPAGIATADVRPEEKFLAAAEGRPVAGEYLVVFEDGVPAAHAAEQAAGENGGVVRKTWRHAINGALLTSLDRNRARAIANRPGVRWVEENQVVEIVATQFFPPSWGLDRVDQRNLPLDAAYTYDFDGAGVHVFVIDTGIRASHVDFGARASADFDSIGDGQNGADCHGHGTHVAGTVGGAAHGVAKGARLHGVRVLDCWGFGTIDSVVDGIDWVTANHQSPAVANMSLGGPVSVTLDTALNNSVAAGVFHVVAAGNESQSACNRSPAGAASAYTAAATTSGDVRASFSNYGTCVEIFAPGVGITSAWSTSDTATATISGTSMASPHVAGAAALLLDETPGLSPAQLAEALTERATCGVVVNKGTGSPNRLLYTLAGAEQVCEPEPPETICDVKSVKETSIGVIATHNACRRLEAGPALTIEDTGSVTLQAGSTVVLFDGFQVESGGTLKVQTCGHSLCNTGAKFVSGCHACVGAICAVDPFCCATFWDSICVGEVASVCGFACP
jgi:subtilisin family serine protease